MNLREFIDANVTVDHAHNKKTGTVRSKAHLSLWAESRHMGPLDDGLKRMVAKALVAQLRHYLDDICFKELKDVLYNAYGDAEHQETVDLIRRVMAIIK